MRKITSDCDEQSEILEFQVTRKWRTKRAGAQSILVERDSLTQNLFPQGKNARTISLNAHYIIAFKNPRDALSVRILAQQAFPHKVPFVMESFQDATTRPYGYLLFDLHPSTPEEYRLRTNILDPFPLAYKENNI